MTLICPYTKDCILYKNWVEKTRDERVNIIDSRFSGKKNYYCLALDAHNDICEEGGITFNKEVSKRIIHPNVEKNLNLGDIECSHITLLNFLKGGK